jgi:type IV secretory pathway VirJ component
MKPIMTCCLLLVYPSLFGQQGDFPVTFFNSGDTSKPLIFYISGDGGWNGFSASLARALNKKGYAVAGLNARSYFWEKKTPGQAAGDISAYLKKTTAQKTNGNIVFAGYSFGADVLPFIISSLPETDRAKTKAVVLLSPSSSTDFEIHWADLVGWDKKRSMDVAAAINRLDSLKVLAVFGDDEKGFPLHLVHLKNFSHQALPGGHHFQNDMDSVAKAILTGI